MMKLTPELHRQIVNSIRSGGFPAVAANAWGVPETLFETWLARGQAKNAREPYRSFARDIEAARAQARLTAEIAAFKQDPKCWLQRGPGKEMPGNPGWSSPTKPILATSNDPAALFRCPEFLDFLAKLRAALAPFPDALAAVEKAMQ